MIQLYFPLIFPSLILTAPIRLDLGIMIRSFGVGWLFGDLGYFSSTAIGRVKVFARRSDNRILITTSRRGNFIIAPDDPEFIHYLNQAILWR